MYSIGTMLIYGRDKGCREICSNIFDINTFPLYTLSETIQGIRTLSFSDIEYAAASQVHDDCLVNMPFPDGKLINANAIDIIQRRWCIMTLQIPRMDILDCIPGDAQQIGGILQGHTIYLSTSENQFPQFSAQPYLSSTPVCRALRHCRPRVP